MENVVNFQRRIGVDIGYHESNIHPIDGEGCVGKSGIDKTFTLQQVLSLAYKFIDKPNIIIKSGPNGKWYLKRFNKDVIEKEIEKQNWRDTSRCIMYIIEWE